VDTSHKKPNTTNASRVINNTNLFFLSLKWNIWCVWCSSTNYSSTWT